MRLVLDTNVVASALLWGGAPRLLLQAAREKRIELFTSTSLLAELTDILGRRSSKKRLWRLCFPSISSWIVTRN
jgi:putative PIN family toxin of toxin-antitoxin system